MPRIKTEYNCLNNIQPPSIFVLHDQTERYSCFCIWSGAMNGPRGTTRSVMLRPGRL